MAEKKKKDAAPKDKSGKKDKGKDKDEGEENEKKGKKSKKGKGGDEAAQGGSIANHPRARSAIRRCKAGVGLAGFAITALLSLKASTPAFNAILHALGAGVAGYMLAWWFSVMIWRQLIIAEQKAHYAALEKKREEEGDKPAAERPRPAATPQPQPAG